MAELKSGVTVVLGGQWGDEGKGKLVDILAQEADVVARCQVRIIHVCCAIYVSWPSCHLYLWKKDPPTPLVFEWKVLYTVYTIFVVQGGNNAGHTVKVGSQAYDFHLLPRYALAIMGYTHTLYAKMYWVKLSTLSFCLFCACVYSGIIQPNCKSVIGECSELLARHTSILQSSKVADVNGGCVDYVNVNNIHYSLRAICTCMYM